MSLNHAAARILSCGSLYTQLPYWRECLVRVYEVSVDEKLTTLQNIKNVFFRKSENMDLSSLKFKCSIRKSHTILFVANSIKL
jgi:hypothetical protein